MQCSRLSLYVATVHRYTTFTVKWPSAPPPTPSIDNSNLTATASFTVQVTNTGPRDGDEVVQAYCVPGVSSDPLLRQIVAFQRVHVPAGSAEEVTLTVTPMDFIQVDTAGDSFSVPGTYQVLLTNGNDQTDAMVMATVKITGTKRTVATFD